MAGAGRSAESVCCDHSSDIAVCDFCIIKVDRCHHVA